MGTFFLSIGPGLMLLARGVVFPKQLNRAVCGIWCVESLMTLVCLTRDGGGGTFVYPFRCRTVSQLWTFSDLAVLG